MKHAAIAWIPMLIIAAGASTPSAGRADEVNRMSLAEKSACEADGGRVATVGLLGHEHCVGPMKDAGKSCTDGSQCGAGQCVWDERSSKTPPAAGANAAGVCPGTNFGFGCAVRISGGKSQGGMCID
jgi:hypothetical protein